MTLNARNLTLIAVVIVIIGSITYLESQKSRPSVSASLQEIVQCQNPGPDGSCTTTSSSIPETVLSTGTDTKITDVPSNSETSAYKAKATRYERFVEIVNPSGFINTGEVPVTISSLIGKKVVLVDFWTYSCINCQRTLPYLTDWYTKYRDSGLEIISIHTPEFEFEKDRTNVIMAAQRFGVEYPIIQDNDFSTWRAYKNSYWPRKYLIDIDGFIVYDHIGEGAYAETESLIQNLLKERNERLGETMTPVSSTKVEAETVDPSKPRTPEIYFGSFRNSLLGNGARYINGTQTLTLPSEFDSSILYLGGSWNIQTEYATPANTPARVLLKYQAQKVFMVARANTPVRARVLIDGTVIPSSMRGADVGSDGYLTIQEDRLYRIVEGMSWGEHTLELIIESPEFEAFTFTFG